MVLSLPAMSLSKLFLFLGLLSPWVAPMAAAQAELRIAVNSTTLESLPVFVAAESMSAGIRLVPVPSGRVAMAQLLDGTVDAATGSETQALLNSTGEAGMRIVLTLAECRYRIIARRSAGIRRIADLRGKRIATTVNTSAHYYLAGMLRGAGLAESDVRMVALEGQEMPAALEKGSVDAVSIWEPHAQSSMDVVGADAVVFEDASVYKERFNLNTRAAVLSDPSKRAALARFVQAIIRASAEIRNRPAKFMPVAASKLGLPERTISAVWKQFRFPGSLPGELGTELNRVEPWVAAMQKRTPRSRQDLAGLIDRSVLKATD